MFKDLLQRIIDANSQQDAIDNVFYGTQRDASGKIVVYGVDMAYQHGKITWDEHAMLLAIINKMA